MQALEPATTPSVLLPLRPRTAFERNLLPGFARWLVERIEDERPDYLIPAETKGARLLEEVIAYARDVLGVAVKVPVLYGTGLAYLDAETLRKARVMIVDDAVRTGQNLARHRQRIERYGAEDISAVACIAYNTQPAELEGVACFGLIEDIDLYREYVWQLTELVVARGLPPEVDHHVLTLRLPYRLPLAWQMLRDVLLDHGDLSVDDALGDESGSAGMTLHFPLLPGTIDHSPDGDVRIEGVNKLRFFPDPASGDIHVVPVSFPALDLHDVDADSELVPRERALELVRDWTRGSGGIGELLVEQARVWDAEMVFRALSTVTEVDLLGGLARVLGGAFPAANTSLLSQRELFHRLYGGATGETVAERIDSDVRAALESASPESTPRSAHAGKDRALALDAHVVEGTIRVARHLKDRYDRRARESGHVPGETVGESLSELAGSVGMERLLASRCLDYGLSMTTLVPYVHVERVTDDRLTVRREYRVSEINRDLDHGYEDPSDMRQRLSEEAVAFISYYLRTRSRRYRGGAVPVSVIASLASIMRPLVFAAHELALGRRVSGPRTDAMLREPPLQQTLRAVTSEMFICEHDGEDEKVRTTAKFDTLCQTDRLHIDRRGETIEIEDFLRLLVGVIDMDGLDDDTLERVLSAWAMSTDERLGLECVGAELDAALQLLENPLKACLRGEPHRHGTTLEAHKLIEHSRELLDQLESDWASTVRAAYPDSSKRERALLGSLAAAGDSSAIYALAASLIELASSLLSMVQVLDAASAGAWADGGSQVHPAAVAAAVQSGCERVQRVLTSMRETGQVVALPTDSRDAIDLAAGALLAVLAHVRAFGAACAGNYRGARGARAVREREQQRMGAVLFVDLSRSTEHALAHAVAVNHAWKNSGLNLIAQWGKAFGGHEMKDREGDAIWLEFSELGDPAVLCAAAVQEHARVLRSTGVQRMWWGFHVAVDSGQLTDGDGGNVNGICLDRAAKLSKGRGGEEGIEQVLVTPEAADLCSPALREPPCMTAFGHEIELSAAGREEHNLPGARVAPQLLDSAAVVRRLAERIVAAGREIASAVPAGPTEPPLIGNEADESPHAKAEEDASGEASSA